MSKLSPNILNDLILYKRFIKLNKTGGNYSGICPFCRDLSKTFAFNKKLNISNCFNCGKGFMDFKSFLFEISILHKYGYINFSINSKAFKMLKKLRGENNGKSTL